MAGLATALVVSARGGGHGVRLGVDGAVRSDTGQLADAVTGLLRDSGLLVVRASLTGFVRPRSIRYEHGDDPLAPLGALVRRRRATT